MGKKKIMVACGTGIATSTVVVNKMSTLLKERGVDVDIQQCKVSELPYKTDKVDLIVTTTAYTSKNDIPVIVAVSFLTGIGVDKDLDKIIEILNK
ncbi:MAG: PTS sugar transporter subunit IIB [Fusobacteriales bacterium]|jgi:PTS system galactitol-specific IIB component|nr:PTS sugar transporter subunit IIB [Fusobacteriales bacterium]